MELPNDTVPKLLRHEQPVVSGLYHIKSYPFSPIAGWNVQVEGGIVGRVNGHGKMWKKDYCPLPKNKLVEVDWCGIGCLMVDMKVFDKIPFPCFWDDWDREKGTRERGHDLVFCDTVKAYGYRVFVDTSVRCGHRVLFTIDPLFIEAFYRSGMAETVKQILDEEGDYTKHSHRAWKRNYQSVSATG